jgi:uncharacterized repeat protein (TIGR01451 family)
MKVTRMLIAVSLGLGLALALPLALGGATLLVTQATAQHHPVQRPRLQAGDVLTVCPAVAGICPYTSVQAAVDAAHDGDVIKVAAGTYTGVNNYGGLAQVVYISKTVTVRGGYTPTNWATPYPITQPTTLDALGQGRVLYITGDISPTVEGLHITGGHTTGDGGGVYVITATATLKDNRVFSNTADSGGGLSLSHSAATLSANIVTSNTAALLGGGLYLVYSPATLSDNVVSSNTADFQGGGLYLDSSGATLSENTVASNTAVFGGGLFADGSDNVLFSDNTVSLNTASGGGGLFLYESAATISGNTVATNTADVGAGLDIHHSAVTISGNTITSNTANLAAGGLELYGGSATFRENIATFNTADACGGMGLSDSDAVLTNTIVADNHAYTAGSGLCIGGSSFRLLHTTIARNTGGDGSGVYVTDGDTQARVFLTNTILVSQTVGITVTTGNTATLEGTLWGSGAWANEGDWGGAGTVVTGTVNLRGDPAFVDPDAGDYHIDAGSAAIDAGVDAGVAVDVDGEPRPLYNSYDIGADEYDSGCYARLNDGAVYSTVQAAVDASTRPTDVVKVAGHCAGVQVRAGMRQTIYLSKTVTIRGGYTTTDWATPYPITQPTTLDALGQGRVLYITGDVSPTVEGVRITGGHTAGDGGGVYIITATATISNNWVFSNTADFQGGGLYLSHSAATLSGNTVISNSTAAIGWAGGGLSLEYSAATLSGNIIRGNTASTSAGGYGGGLYLVYSPATLTSNTITSNTAHSGGGLFLWASDATISGNTVSYNTARDGGGLLVFDSTARLRDNTVSGNNAANVGGGLILGLHSDPILSGNTVSSNTAWIGGGLYIDALNANLDGNTVISNTAGYGGGLYLGFSPATLTNTIVTSNRAIIAGSGLCVYASSSARLLHTTIARNSGGDGSGVYVTNWEDYYSTVALTNTILVSQTVGISVTGGNTVTVDAVLWYGTPTTVSQAATATVTVLNQHEGDPAFVDPDAGDYHIGAGSAAIDAGVDAGVDYDIDGEPRPMGAGYDIGADELGASLAVTKWAIPSVARAGAPLTYTIRVTNTGNVTLTAIVTDALPNLVTPTGVFTWTPTITAPGGVWTEMVVVTVEMGYSGPLTNVVEVTTKEGATGAGSLTVSVVCYKNYLPLVLRH